MDLDETDKQYIFMDKFYKLNEKQARILQDVKLDRITHENLIKYRDAIQSEYEKIIELISDDIKRNIISNLILEPHKINEIDFFKRYEINKFIYDRLIDLKNNISTFSWYKEGMKDHDFNRRMTDLLTLDNENILKIVSRYVTQEEDNFLYTIQQFCFINILKRREELILFRTLFNSYKNIKILFLSTHTHIITFIVNLDNATVEIFDPSYDDKTINMYYITIKLLINYCGIDSDRLNYEIFNYNLQQASDDDDSVDIFCKAWCYYYIINRHKSMFTMEQFKYIVTSSRRGELQREIKIFLLNYIKKKNPYILDECVEIINHYQQVLQFGGNNLIKYKFKNQIVF